MTILAPYRRLKYKEEDNKAAAFTLELSWSSITSQSKKNLFYFISQRFNLFMKNYLHFKNLLQTSPYCLEMLLVSFSLLGLVFICDM